MSLYRERVLPRLVDRACGSRDMHRWRARVTEGLFGEVLEIGFGSGLNLGHYPPEVTRILAVDPSGGAQRLAADRVARCPVPVEPLEIDAERLPLPDAGCDAALSTFTLCTIPDAERALGEVHRVLKPGGALHFLEHGAAPDASVAAWQRRLEPLQRRLAGGCHLTRDPVGLVTAAGFSVKWSEARYARGPRPWTYFTIGVATRS